MTAECHIEHFKIFFLFSLNWKLQLQLKRCKKLYFLNTSQKLFYLLWWEAKYFDNEEIIAKW